MNVRKTFLTPENRKIVEKNYEFHLQELRKTNKETNEKYEQSIKTFNKTYMEYPDWTISLWSHDIKKKNIWTQLTLQGYEVIQLVLNRYKHLYLMVYLAVIVDEKLYWYDEGRVEDKVNNYLIKNKKTV